MFNNLKGVSYPRRWNREKLFTEVLPFKRAGVTNKHLAEKYGVSQSRMSQIIAKALRMEKNHIRLNLGVNNV